MEHLPLVTVGLARVRPSVISGDAEDGQAAVVDLERHNVKLSGGMVEAILAWRGGGASAPRVFSLPVRCGNKSL